MLPAGGLNLKSPPFRGGPGRRLGWPGGKDSENRIAWSRLRDVLCASAAGLHRNPLRIRLPPAPLTRRAGSVAQSSIGRALHGRPAERPSPSPAQPCHGGTRAARRPLRPYQLSDLRSALRSVRLYAGQVSRKCWGVAVDEWGAAGARACRLSARPLAPSLGKLHLGGANYRNPVNGIFTPVRSKSPIDNSGDLLLTGPEILVTRSNQNFTHDLILR
jgi:hypothetical protein